MVRFMHPFRGYGARPLIPIGGRFDGRILRLNLWLSRLKYRIFLAPTSFELATVYYQPEAELSESEIRI